MELKSSLNRPMNANALANLKDSIQTAGTNSKMNTIRASKKSSVTAIQYSGRTSNQVIRYQTSDDVHKIMRKIQLNASFRYEKQIQALKNPEPVKKIGVDRLRVFDYRNKKTVFLSGKSGTQRLGDSMNSYGGVKNLVCSQDNFFSKGDLRIQVPYIEDAEAMNSGSNLQRSRSQMTDRSKTKKVPKTELVSPVDQLAFIKYGSSTFNNNERVPKDLE